MRRSFLVDIARLQGPSERNLPDLEGNELEESRLFDLRADSALTGAGTPSKLS